MKGADKKERKCTKPKLRKEKKKSPISIVFVAVLNSLGIQSYES